MSPARIRSRARRALAPAALALLALPAIAALGCEEDKPAATAPAPTSTASAAPEASAKTTAAEQGGAPDAAPPDASAAAEPPVASAEATASAAPTSTGAKPDAGTKPSKDAGATSAGGTKASAADAGGGDAGGSLAGGDAPAPSGSAAPSGVASLPAPAPGSADAIAAEIDTIFTGKRTFKAAFKQEHTQKVTGAVKKSSGTVFVEKPNKLSFRYDPPNKNRIVSDGTELKVYVAEDEQMFVQPVAKTQYPGALSFLMGNGLRPSFTFTISEKPKFEGGPVLNGKPRSPTPYYEYVLFYVDKALLEKKDPGVIRRVLIVDAQGNRNRFDFENVSQPDKIDPGEFVFTPPAGTNIQQGAK